MSERHSELKIVRWTERIQGILGGDPQAPIRANVDLTNLCSHSCPWCEPLDFRRTTIADRRHTLSYEVAGAVLIDLADMGCEAIQFSGGGEPMLHPEFGPLLNLAKAKKMRTFVITNGGFLGKWERDIFASCDRIRISLDASCDDEHQKMHGSKAGEFGHVVEGIKTTVERKFAGSGPEVGLAYIVTDCNSSWESIERVMRLAAKWGVNYVQFRPISEDSQQLLTEDWFAVSKRIELTCAMVPSVKAYITGQRHRDVFLQREFQKCYAALTLAVISANGEVCACCDRRDLTFGNVNDRPFRSIWLSDEHRRKAAMIAPKLCTRCVQCGTNRGIEKFVVNNEAAVEVI